jgi:hypothetical protein
VVGAQPAQLPFAPVDLDVQVVDQAHRGGGGPRPRLRQLQPVQQLPPARAEQVSGRARPPEGQQRGVNSVLQRGPVPDQVQPEAGPLPLRTHPRGGQPDRGHQLTAAQLRQHPRVDPVGLARQWRQPFDLLRVGDLHLPAAQLELVVDEPGAVHRPGRRDHRLPQPGDLAGQPTQPVNVWWRGGDLYRLARFVHQMHIHPLARQIQPCVQHGDGASSGASRW